MEASKGNYISRVDDTRKQLFMNIQNLPLLVQDKINEKLRDDIREYARANVFPKLKRPYIYMLIDAIVVCPNTLNAIVSYYQPSLKSFCAREGLEYVYNTICRNAMKLRYDSDYSNMYREFAINSIMPHLYKLDQGFGKIVESFEKDSEYMYKNRNHPILQLNKKWDIHRIHMVGWLNVSGIDYINCIDGKSLTASDQIYNSIICRYLNRDSPRYEL